MATKKTKKFFIGGRAFGPAAPTPTKVVSGGGKPAPVNPANINPIRTIGGGGKPAPVPVRGGPGYEQHTGGPMPASVNPATVNPIRTPGGGGKPALVNQPISGNPTGGQPRPASVNPATVNPIRTPGGGMAKGGKVKSASARADGCATKGKTKGRFV